MQDRRILMANIRLIAKIGLIAKTGQYWPAL